MKEWLTLQFDGGSRGNPGPSGIGVVVSAEDGTPLVTLGRYIGNGTNNVAEYRALITAMQEALKLGARRVIIRGDSQLIVRQMQGVYRVKNPGMKRLYDEAQSLLRQFEATKIEHNLRHKNELADKLANLAMDRRVDVTETSGSSGMERAAVPNSAEPSGPAAISPLDAPSPIAPEPGAKFACTRCGCVIHLERVSTLRPHQLKPFACQCGAAMTEAHIS